MRIPYPPCEPACVNLAIATCRERGTRSANFGNEALDGRLEWRARTPQRTRKHPDRRLRLALRSLARRVLSARSSRNGSSFEYASSAFSTLEINGSFYSLQISDRTGSAGTQMTPESFMFSVEGTPLHHPHAEAARCRAGARELLRIRRARPCRRSWARSSGSCPPHLPLRARTHRSVSWPCCRTIRRRRCGWRGGDTHGCMAAAGSPSTK